MLRVVHRRNAPHKPSVGNVQYYRSVARYLHVSDTGWHFSSLGSPIRYIHTAERPRSSGYWRPSIQSHSPHFFVTTIRTSISCGIIPRLAANSFFMSLPSVQLNHQVRAAANMSTRHGSCPPSMCCPCLFRQSCISRACVRHSLRSALAFFPALSHLCSEA